MHFITIFGQFKSSGVAVDRGSVRPPEKGKVPQQQKTFWCQNLKTLQVGSLSVSVNSKSKIIEPPTLDPPTIEPIGVARGAAGRTLPPERPARTYLYPPRNTNPKQSN